MGKLKEIMYGVTDFARFRAKNGYFVDRTDLIPELEKTSYTVFLRPRRFGKSLLVSILQAYYDVDYAHRFDELFGGLKIAANPTEERGQYFTLCFNFSGVDKRLGNVQESFDEHCRLVLDQFARHYAVRLPASVVESILAAKTCNGKMNALCSGLKGTDVRLYIFIDEYDNFTNTILAEHGTDAYNALCHGEGFFKQFFTELKLATTGLDAPVSRLFITGVSPITLDDVTSGFNIGFNVSTQYSLATLTGFTQSDLREMLEYYRREAFDFDIEFVLKTMTDWYDHYVFSPETRVGGALPQSVASPILVLCCLKQFLESRNLPADLIDENLRTDYAKIRHVITEGRKLNGNYHRIEEIIAGEGVSGTLVKSFQAREITKGDNFVSFLYYMGLVTIGGKSFGEVTFKVPNLTVAEFMHDFVPRAYEDVNGIDPRIYDISKGLYDFARFGDWRKALGVACEVVSSYWKVRDAIEGEKVVQTALASLLYVAHGPYLVSHEGECAHGFVDIAINPELWRYPEITSAAQIELKYFKASDAVTAETLEEVKAAAREQLARYARDKDIARKWNLKPIANVTEGVPNGTVDLKRILVVFHGGELVCCEEV